ncbi:maleylpyruvate isomerase family mycothiol-dependent enzyme [Nocardia sp. NPDC051030]|uniref:maleylpyruvate isomerase family mycothiol-dependent enzyme n=1 Tax=Nocardia sp. NPDC051030 TaxID=3155162 RepID=UPI003444133A
MSGSGVGDVRELVRVQRGVLGGLVESLDDAEWGRASLCEDWSVGDVVAHCVQSHVATPLVLAREWVTAGFRLAVRNERWVTRWRGRSRGEVVGEYRATADRLGFPSAELPYALAEVVVHGYDIAWPLGRGIEASSESLVVVADTCCRTGVFLHSKQRCAGLALRAGDVEWSSGRGREVTGPLASIVMAIAGRGAALEDLSGDGVETLRARL